MRGSPARLALALLLLSGVSAYAAAQEPPAGIPRGAHLVAFQPLESFPRLYSGIEGPRRTVVRDPGAWAELWSEIVRDREPKNEPPPVDFACHMVIVAAMGARPTGGFSIAIERVYRSADRLFVEVRERSPGANCMVTQALTQPADAAVVPRSDLPVSFAESKEIRDCP